MRREIRLPALIGSLTLAGLVLLLCLLLPGGALAGTTYDCADCHGSVVNDFTLGPVDRNNCSSCHQTVNHFEDVVLTPYGYFKTADSPFAPPATVHGGIYGTNHVEHHGFSPEGICYSCHATVSCRSCHGTVPHGEHGSTKYPPVSVATNLGNPETFYCGSSLCHTTLPDVARYRPDGTDLCLNCHPVDKSGHGDVTPLHTSNFIANPQLDCASCHSPVLSKEHPRWTDSAGNPHTCLTCHRSTRTDVQQAISNNQTNCDACHTIHADVTTVHTSNFVANPQLDCASCHSPVLSEEHPKWTDSAGNPHTCDTCHKSTRTDVQQAIKNGQTNCDACHGPVHTDLAQKHVSTTPGCSSCHFDEATGMPVLTSIHLSGCGTCHSSANTYVREAIIAQATDCLSCHRIGGATHPHSVSAHESVNCQACHLEEKSVLDQSVHGATRANLECRSCHRNLAFPDPYADSVDLGDECTKCHKNKVNMGGDKGCVPCHLNPGESFVNGNQYWGHYFKKRNNEEKSVSNPK